MQKLEKQAKIWYIIIMLKRKIYQNLKEWKKSKSKECLILKGARQVGKTYIVDLFGKNEYKSYIYINFDLYKDQMHIFDGNLSADEIYKRISIYVDNIKLIEKETLIFIDEIEMCPNARTALKSLALDDRYDVIASGSLLGMHYKDIVSIPVGYEKHMEMFSLDLEEFMWAKGINEIVFSEIKKCFIENKKVDNLLNDKILDIVNEYMVVGGMPEAVNCYIKTNNIQEVNEVQNKILNGYRDDAIKYAIGVNKQKVIKCFDSIPQQLSKDYTKFQYKIVECTGNARKYEDSILWLEDAGVIKKCYNVSTPEFPIKAFVKMDQFKVYMTDIGLLMCMYGLKAQQLILKKGLKNTSKGGMYENLVFDILIKRRYDLCYYKNDKNTQEIEFIYDGDDTVIPIEVKAKNGRTISLNNFINIYKPKNAYKFIYGNIGFENGITTLPYYMLLFI